METLHALYYRTKYSDDDFRNLVGPFLLPSTLSLLHQLYQWLDIDPTDIDEEKYLLLKKFSEVSVTVQFLPLALTFCRCYTILEDSSAKGHQVSRKVQIYELSCLYLFTSPKTKAFRFRYQLSIYGLNYWLLSKSRNLLRRYL